MAYIYPDYFTAIVGTFNDGVLVAGRASSVKSISQQKVGLVPPAGRSDVKVLQGVVVPVFHPGSGPLLEREIASQARCAGLGDGKIASQE